MNEQWQQRNRPARLERRYQFEDYDSLRDFLDQAAELSERVDYFPDMGFGRDYVNITIHANDGEDELDNSKHQFAKQLDELVNATTH